MSTVAVDFDGVIHCYSSGWTGYTPCDAPEPGALLFISRLLDDGYEVVVMSTRAETDEGRIGIEQWLTRHGFPVLRVTHEKVMAVAYVDDRAIPYDTGSNQWAPIHKRVLELTNRHNATKNGVKK